jgi:phosphoribosylformylglycinamidine cyclo-ligase
MSSEKESSEGGSGSDPRTLRALAHPVRLDLLYLLEREGPLTASQAADLLGITPPPVFDLVRRVGSVSQPDLEATLNCGVGMVAVVDPRDADEAVRTVLGEWGGPESPL